MAEHSAIELIPGARAAEARLLELVLDQRGAARADPALLARPVRVVVPSRSLRLHVCERIAAELGATAGVAVQTLHGLALEIVERAGGDPCGRGEALIEVLALRAARAEPLLVAGLEGYRDGYRPVEASVRDLLDAGLTPELARPLAECLAEARVSGPERERAGAVLRVAVAVTRVLVARGFGRALLLARACEALRRGPGVLPARALYVHGFADLTGRAADLVEALMQHAAGRVLLDRPPDPATPGEGDPGAAFSARLVGRLQGVGGLPRRVGLSAAAPALDLFRAPGASAEVREVARRLHDLLGNGVRPERCGVVARDLGPYRAALRAHFRALGVPCSGLRARAPLDGAGARIQALCELLEGGRVTRTDRWLDALARYPLATAEGGVARVWRRPREELRIGLRLAGAWRLEQVPGIALDPANRGLALPLRRGLERAVRTADANDGPPPLIAPRAWLAADDLRSAQACAKRLLRRLERWSELAPLDQHQERFRRARKRDLGWRSSDLAEQRLRSALEDLALDLDQEPLERAEFALLVERAAAGTVEPPLGGSGGGVQVLEVMEARGRTFEHLFVLGLERGSFPRPVREDALLGDDLRAALATLLPEIPIKARGRDEERYLFAELLSSSPRVTLSWQIADDDGRARVVSPLCARLFGAGGEESVAQVLGVHDPAASGPRTAREAALAGGLEHGLDGHRERLAAALAEHGPEPGSVAALADTRTRILEAFEDGPFQGLRLAPWLGFLGGQDAAGIRPDPRAEPIYVTRLEGLAICPWRTFLEKLLRLEPQALRLQGLATADARLIGNVAHKVLEDIAVTAGVPSGGRLEEVLAREGWSVPWPGAEGFDGLLYGAARSALAAERERDPHAGHVRLLAECTRELLERARDFLAHDARRFADTRLLGVEVEGRAVLELDGARIGLAFEADRVERREGRAVLSDYKTGAVPKRKALAEGLAAGQRLQPAAYALAAGGDPPARGRYLFLKAENEEVEAGAAQGPGEPFGRAVRTLVAAWVAGAFFPRLEDPSGAEPDACERCEVALACLRGDSGARRALVELARAPTREVGALARLFYLHPKGLDRLDERMAEGGA